MLTLNSSRDFDPSRTLTLRRQFVSDINKRGRDLKGAIRKSIVENDCFGLRKNPLYTFALEPAPKDAFSFRRSADKVTGFMEWLNAQEEKGVLEIVHRFDSLRGIEDAWTDVYIRRAYDRGVLTGRQELRKAGYDVPVLTPPEVPALLAQPMHADRLGVLFTRTFSELKGVTRAMDQQISRVLADGLMRGDNPEIIAKALNNRVGKIGITRWRTVARTEIVRAHHVANIAEFEQWGVDGVKVQAEWLTGGFRVCPICQSLEGKVFPLKEIEGMIPRHPNCKCAALPVDAPKEKRRRAA